MAAKVWSYCEARQITGRTVTLKVKYSDFQQITRSKTSGRPVADSQELLNAACLLLADIYPITKAIRLLGVTLASLDNAEACRLDGQLKLF